MNLGPAEALIILLILAILVVPITVGVLFLVKNRGLDDSRQAQAYPPGWEPPPGIFHAVFPSRRGLVPAVRGFLDFLGEAITAQGLLPV